MPSPKSGKPGSPVPPGAPKKPTPADVATPGSMTKIQKPKEEKSAQPHKPDEEKTSWIEIELIDENDEPVPGEKYRVTLPDESVAEGTLNEKGFARIDGIDPGTCQITFPRLDKETWEKV